MDRNTKDEEEKKRLFYIPRWLREATHFQPLNPQRTDGPTTTDSKPCCLSLLVCCHFGIDMDEKIYIYFSEMILHVFSTSQKN